jgi:NADH:ubiquinone oxidoreductase subunit 6 (subunit J)
MKYLVIVGFLVIIGTLASALVFMMKGQGDEKSKNSKMAWALAARVGVSIVLFVSILVAWKLGYIQPSGISAGQ